MLLTCRSFAWTSSPRLPTWSSTRPWRTPWSLASNQPVCRPLRWLWVSISCYTFLQPVTYYICIFFFFVFTCLTSLFEQVRVNSLVCLGKILEYLDKWFVLDEILPFLQQIPSKEPAVLMGILGTDTSLSFLVIYKKEKQHKHMTPPTASPSRNLQVHLQSQEVGHPQRAPCHQEPAPPGVSEYRRQPQPEPGIRLKLTINTSDSPNLYILHHFNFFFSFFSLIHSWWSYGICWVAWRPSTKQSWSSFTSCRSSKGDDDSSLYVSLCV